MVVLLADRMNPANDVSQHYDLQYRNEPNNILYAKSCWFWLDNEQIARLLSAKKEVREKRAYNADRKGLTSILLPRTMADPCDILPGSMLLSVSCLKWYFTFKIEGFSFMPCPLCAVGCVNTNTRDGGLILEMPNSMCRFDWREMNNLSINKNAAVYS